LRPSIPAYTTLNYLSACVSSSSVFILKISAFLSSHTQDHGEGVPVNGCTPTKTFALFLLPIGLGWSCPILFRKDIPFYGLSCPNGKQFLIFFYISSLSHE